VIAAARENNIRVRGYISNLFGYDDLPFSPDIVAKRSKQLLDMGCFEISLGDTTGIGKANQVAPIIDALKAAGVPLEKIAMHFHDTFGNAMENVAESYRLGIRTFDAATGGLGGCPYANSPKGNLAMEKLVAWAQRTKYFLRRFGHRKTPPCGGVHVEEIGKDGVTSLPEFCSYKILGQSSLLSGSP
jgi:isopropylmalate/homocitrate/citramalate synthase